MAEIKLVIPGALPGMNDIIDLAKKHWAKYADMKKTYTNMVHWLAKGKGELQRVEIHIAWYEPNLKRDPDNISAGEKFILDGLVAAGVIPNDGQKQIAGITHTYLLDRKNPRVEVTVKGVE